MIKQITLYTQNTYMGKLDFCKYTLSNTSSLLTINSYIGRKKFKFDDERF